MALSSSFWGSMPAAGGNAAGQAATTPQPQQHSGGFLGSLYDATLKGPLDTVAGGVRDLQTIGASGVNLGKIGAGLVTGNMKAASNAANDQYKNLQGSNFVQNYTTGMAGSGGGSGSVGKSLEKSLGKTASNIANVAAFTPAGGAIKGASVGSKLLKAGALGAGFGATQGAASEMAQGNSLDQVGQGALVGGLTGAATGAALHGTGMAAKGVFNKLTGKAGDVGPGGTGGFMGKTAAKKGATDAQNIQAKNAEPFANAQRGVNNATGYDKNGLPVSHQQVNDALRILNMTSDINGAKTSDNMQALHDLGTSIIGDHLVKATNGITVDASSAAQKGMNAVADNQGFIGGGKNGAAEDTRQQIRVATKGLGGKATVDDVRQAISTLEGYQKDLAGGVAANDRVSVGQNNAYQAVLDHLNKQLDANRVDRAVSDYTMNQSDRNALIAKVKNGGGSPELANYLQNVVDNGASFASQRTAMQIPVVAGNLARAARLAESQHIPGAPTAEPGGGDGLVPTAVVAAAAPHAAPYLLSRGVGARYNAMKSGLAKAVNPGAYQSGLAEGLAPNDATAARINVGEPQPAPPPDIVIPGMPATPGSPETPTSIQFPQAASSAVQLPVQGARPAAAGIPAGTTLTPANGYNPTLSQLNMTKAQLAAQSILREGKTIPGTPGTPPTPGTPDQVIPGQPPVQAAGGTPPPPPPVGAGGPAAMLSGLAGNAAQSAGTVLPGGIRNTLAGEAGTGMANVSTGTDVAPVAPGLGAVGGSQIDQLTGAEQGAMNPQSTLDASSIPGGTLADYQAEVAADPSHEAYYKNMYDEAQKEIAASAPPKLNATEAKNLTNIQNATQTLSQYVGTLNSLNASTRGAGVGSLSTLLGKMGIGGANATSAAYLQSKRPELAIQIAQAMNNGTKPQGQQIKDIEAMLPSVNDPKALATQKIEQLAQSMQAYLNTAASASVSNRGSGNTSNLLSQLTGGQ